MKLRRQDQKILIRAFNKTWILQTNWPLLVVEKKLRDYKQTGLLEAFLRCFAEEL